MSQNITLEKLFESATWIASDGRSSSSQGSASILKSSLSNDTKYYLIGYCSDAFAIFSYLNGVSEKLFDYTGSYNITLFENDTDIYVSYNSDNTQYSLGITALTFDIDADIVFKNLTGKYVTGYSNSYKYVPSETISNFAEEGSTRYVFVCTAWYFCLYKAEGILYSDLTLIYNHYLYLLNHNDTDVIISYSSSQILPSDGLYGCTLLSVEG